MTFEEAEKEISKIIVGEQFKILDILQELQATYAPKIKMTTQEFEFFNSRYKTKDSRGLKVFIDANGKKIGISHINLHAWLHPELIEVTE